MKKLLIVLGIVSTSMAYSQGVFILNNYSPYDFYGNLLASNLISCFPAVKNRDPDPILVPANANMGNGNALVIKDFQSQYVNSLYPIGSWNVSLSPTNTIATSSNDPSLIMGGALSNNTRWITSKFGMYYAGTYNPVPGFHDSVGNATPNTCYTSSDYITNANGYAEWFVVSNGSIMITYLQVF